MTDHFGRPGRRADLARVYQEESERLGREVVPGGARAVIDAKVELVMQVAQIGATAALKYVDEQAIRELARTDAATWERALAADEALAENVATVSAADAAQLVMGMSMAVGQLVRELTGGLSAILGEPLDAICEIAMAWRTAEETGGAAGLPVTGMSLAIAERTLQRASQGVLGGKVQVMDGISRPGFGGQLADDAGLAGALRRLT